MKPQIEEMLEWNKAILEHTRPGISIVARISDSERGELIECNTVIWKVPRYAQLKVIKQGAQLTNWELIKMLLIPGYKNRHDIR